MISGLMRWAVCVVRWEFKPRAVQQVDLDNSMAFLQVFTTASEFAALPDSTSHPRAEAVGIKSRLESWEWVARQVRGFLRDPDWKHVELIG